MDKLLESLTDEQKAILLKFQYDKNDLYDLEEKLSFYIMEHCIIDDEVTVDGEICESILEKISNI
jgi:hypothetical protein